MSKISPIIRDKLDKRPLYVLIYEQLFQLIETGIFKQGDKLTGETTLAKQLGVSRSSLRQALLILQEDGIIYNVQGNGNYIAKCEEKIGHGLEKLFNATNVFNKEEYQDINIEVLYETPNKWLQTNLQIDSSTLIMTFIRIYKMKTENTCYAISFIPYEIVKSHNIDLTKPEELLTFIDKTVYEYSSTAQTEMKLTTAGEFIAEKLNTTDSKALILIEETIFQEDGRPIIFSKSYFRSEFYNFHINRRKYTP